MRDFKNPYYDGPDCVCCKNKVEAQRERALRILERKLREMIDAPNGVLSVNDLNDLIDEIAYSDKVEFDSDACATCGKSQDFIQDVGCACWVPVDGYLEDGENE